MRQHKLDIPFRNILGIENNNVQGKNFEFDNCEPVLGARECDADTLIKEAAEAMKIKNMTSEKFSLFFIKMT